MLTLPLAAGLAVILVVPSSAQNDGELSPLTVVGSKDRAFDLVGSAVYLDGEDIKQQNYTNINRLLAKVPGVYTREEDGFGLFPNLSIRGNLGTRSEKTTIMEDGILMAPAPYSSPGAYYSPNAGRMSAFEILKGSSQVKYGPHTTGGVINYVSTPSSRAGNHFMASLSMALTIVSQATLTMEIPWTPNMVALDIS